MRVIGLTGSIACGKSTVSGWLKAQPDLRVIDGDLLSRELTAPGGAALPSLRQTVYQRTGNYSRSDTGTANPCLHEKGIVCHHRNYEMYSQP